MADRTRVVVTRNATFEHWVRGLRKLGAGYIPAEAEAEWEAAVEMYFGGTQQYMHIISGDLMAGGEMEMHREGEQLVGQISYGGNRKSDAKPHWKYQHVDYALHELRRGGSHDFFQVALDRLAPAVEHGLSLALISCFQSAVGE